VRPRLAAESRPVQERVPRVAPVAVAIAESRVGSRPTLVFAYFVSPSSVPTAGFCSRRASVSISEYNNFWLRIRSDTIVSYYHALAHPPYRGIMGGS
jgi:hypothetical protein